MIKLENATKYYKTQNENKYILKNANLEIPSNLNVGILGKNGSGKSTFLKMLAGIDFPTSGKITSNKSFSWVMGLAQGLQPMMTGRQNVKFICRIYGKNNNEIRNIVNYVKDFSELDDYFDMPIELYSSGMRSRLAFSLSLGFSFDYLIIDEILSVGDAGFKKKSKAELKNKMEDCNILIVSHSMNTLRELCDAGILIDSGNITYFKHIEDAINVYEQINKKEKKKILSSDGEIFLNVTDAAKYYKVRPRSIQQSMEHNEGTNIFLNKQFWFEGDTKPSYQKWQNIVKNQTIIASDGVIFQDFREAYYFYLDRIKGVVTDANHIEEVLLEDGFSKKLNTKFYYLDKFQF